TSLTLAAHIGMPVSTTHSISTALMGVGFATNPRALPHGATDSVESAWILTIPAARGAAHGLFALLALARWTVGTHHRPSQQVALRRQRTLEAVAPAADLQHQAVDLGGGQGVVGPVLAQLQVGHAVEVVDGQVADPALPVEHQGAAGVDAGDRRDHG